MAIASAHSPFEPSVDMSMIPSPPSTENFAVASTSFFTTEVPTLATVPTSVRIVLPLGRSATAAAFVTGASGCFCCLEQIVRVVFFLRFFVGLRAIPILVVLHRGHLMVREYAYFPRDVRRLIGRVPNSSYGGRRFLLRLLLESRH